MGQGDNAGKISDMLGRLDGRRDLSAYEKMRAYSTFTKSLYPESSDLASGKSVDEIMVRNYDLANSFLEMDSVQSDLRGMSPAERASYLKQLRLSVGLKEDEVRKMAEVDAIRDRLWENGPAYNKERSDIMAKYDGDERERRLDEARKKILRRQRRHDQVRGGQLQGQQVPVPPQVRQGLRQIFGTDYSPSGFSAPRSSGS